MDPCQESDSFSVEIICLNINEDIDFRNLNENLRKLLISGYALSVVPNIQNLQNLRKLWLIGCNIQEADEVGKCHRLKELYLYNNDLTRIPPLGEHTQLKVLWLGENKIESIKANDLPISLEELQIPGNRIKTIENSFFKTYKLKKLNLAGNPLKSIFEIYYLKKVKSLRSLVLCNEMYQDSNEMAQFRHYRSFIILALPQLKQLDTFPIDEIEVELTDIFYENKYLYYTMLRNRIYYEYYFEMEMNFNKSTQALQAIKHNIYLLESKKSKESSESGIDEYHTLKSLLHKDLEKLLEGKHLLQKDIKRRLTIRLSRLIIEQKYFGNIIFEEFGANSELAEILGETLNYFICPFMKKKFHIKGIGIQNITVVIHSRNLIHKEFNLMMDIINHIESAKLYILAEPHFIKSTPDEIYDFEMDSTIFYEEYENSRTVTQCFLLAEDSAKNLMNNRVASLVVLDQNDSIMLQTADHGDKIVQCQIRKIIQKNQFKPYILIDYRYTFEKEEGYGHLSKSQILSLSSGERQMNPYRSFDYKSWNTLQKISFTHQSLNKFGVPGQWLNIKEIDVSYNKFDNLAELFHLFPRLEILKASFNKITHITTNYLMNHLEELDLSWNSLGSLIQTLECLRQCAPEINKLSLQYNSFYDLHDNTPEIFMASIYLKSLSIYNNKNIMESIAAEADPLLIFNKELEIRHSHLIEDTLFDENVNTNIFQETDKSYMVLDSKCLVKFVCLVQDTRFLNIKFDTNTKNLTSLKISNNKLKNAYFLQEMPNLNHLDLSFNMLSSMNGSLFGLTKLVTLNLSGNYISSLIKSKTLELPLLKVLNISKNCFISLFDIELIQNIEELYVGYNSIEKVEYYIFLKAFKNLKIIDVRKNNIIDMNIVRNYLIFHIPNIQYINGTTVTEDEIFEANNDYGGVLDYEYLEAINKLPGVKTLNHLTIINSSIKRVSLKEVVFKHLTSINLENNGLETLVELASLENLKVLNLTGNHISKFGDITSNETFLQLEELHLNSNNIQDLEGLQFQRFPALKKLFLLDNEINNLKGIGGLVNLQVLILDNNKINCIESKHIKKLTCIRELHLQYNCIESLEFLEDINTIEHFYVANNRIMDAKMLCFLKFMTRLESITLSGNPLFKNVDGYVQLLYYLPEVSCIDGVSIEMYKEEENEELNE